ncbi:14839_t:CDS:2 [Entrophospora sp. SA101]|nr:13219_t:CDS:2 [Entrophospora sp. SA101]CAJ0838229.1 14839_t:CDS:2 [Entrophospora sp. SA101]
MSQNPVIEVIRELQEPMPQYVLGLIPVIVTLGAAPFETLVYKLAWIFKSISAPFIGLFYYLVIGVDPVEMCIYWLPEDSFVTTKEKILDFRPVGMHVKDVMVTLKQEEILKNCTANASVLDRLSSLASGYYIIVGIVLGISTMAGQCNQGNWPFLTWSFLWTIPVIFKRTFLTGILVVKDPKIELKGHLIRVLEENEDIEAIKNEFIERGEKPIEKKFDKSYKRLMFIITTLFSHCALYGHLTIL